VYDIDPNLSQPPDEPFANEQDEAQRERWLTKVWRWFATLAVAIGIAMVLRKVGYGNIAGGILLLLLILTLWESGTARRPPRRRI